MGKVFCFNHMNFQIQSNSIVSERFLNINIEDFVSACDFVARLPYKRNVNKNNIECIFNDLGGTCSTKHAILRKLALENDHLEVKLMLGIFKMDADYTPLIKNTLEKFGLKYIPEAHNYLKIDNDYLDFTKPNSKYTDFKNKILIEKEIEFDEISEEKVALHKSFLSQWITDEHLGYNLDEIWKIREQCIQDLQSN